MKKLMNWISRTVFKESEEKNELLQTYFTSLFSLVLCVCMFFGTTYAWFTSEVTNQANEIYIGVLDVELKKQDKNDSNNWLSLSEANAQGVNTYKLFDGSIRWEPGYTSLETIQVVNEGDLAFRYVLQFTEGVVTADKIEEANRQSLEAVADCFDVWVYDHAQETPYAVPASFADINEENGWTEAGSLAQLLAGQPVLQGDMDKEEIAEQEKAKKENRDSDAGLHTYTIALHMKEETDALVMGHKISLNVKLIAYQAASEKDDFGNSDFDNVDMTVIYNANDLRDAVQNAEDGDVILLSSGTYDLTDAMLVVDKAITLMGSDPADKPVLQFVTGDGTGGTNDIVPGIEIKSDNVTLKNLKLAVDPNGISSGYTVRIPYKAADSTEYYSNIMIDGCAFSGSDHCIAMLGNNITIQNCDLDESAADKQGTIIYVWGTSGRLTIRDNEFTGKDQTKHGISFYAHPADDVVADAIAGEILIEGNTFEDVYKGIVHESSMTYKDVSVKILNNTFTNCKYEFVAIDNGEFKSDYEVNGNVFCAAGKDDKGNQRSILANDVGTKVNADGNYWASSAPEWSAVISGDNVTVNNYYADAKKTQLVTIN